MKMVAVGSTNRTKINAVQAVFPEFETSFLKAPSKVLKQPIGNEMTRLGAINRARHCLDKTTCYYSIGLEGGVVFIGEELYLCNWGALITRDNQLYTASGSFIPLPKEIWPPILSGETLGSVLADYTKEKDIATNQGAIGLFTNEMIAREEMYRQIVTLLKGQLYFNLNN